MKARKNSDSNINIVSITQWVVPTAILFIYVLVTLYSFSSNMKSNAMYAVRQRVSEYNDTVVEGFDGKVAAAIAAADSAASAASYEISKGTEITEIVKGMLASTTTPALSTGVKLLDVTGSGFSSTGSAVDAEDLDAMKRCVSEGHYVTSEPFVSGGSWYMCIYSPVKDAKGNYTYALEYTFILDVFYDIPVSSKFDGRTCYALVSNDGTIVSAAGRNVVSRGDNIFDSDSISIDHSSEGRVKNNLINRNSGYTNCTVSGEDRLIVYDPSAYGGLSIASLVTQSYLINESETSYGAMESILIRVVVAMIAFFVAILAINLANKAANHKHNQTLQEKAETDLLTGLLNKISTEQRVTDYLTEAGQRGETAILYMIDIDNFKKVNDTMGHAFGDELLAGLGVGLSTLFRATDIVGRIGGDEFLVVMKNVPVDEETKKREADKLLSFFRSFKVGEYVQYKCTASIGGAVFSRDGADFEALYKSADTAVYEAKRHGKNRVAYYGEELEGPVIDITRHE
jgi:diguanylate cyclase (GGDEF)-like protein